ncbi:MAG: hypothetical protein FWD34_06465 [Oscillospiraceae bacterium]|nr:hypothetical protein [Oscillospiraceae bacterium]
MKRVLVLLIFCVIVVTLCSCPQRSEPITTEPELITAEELLQYIRDNDVGLTEEDLEGVNIDDFIQRYEYTHESIANGRVSLDVMLNVYKKRIYNEKLSEIYAKEIISIDSTDEEFDIFIKKYLEIIGEEYVHSAIYQRMNYYSFVLEEGDYNMYIGRTKFINEYDIKNSGLFGESEIYFSSSDMQWRSEFCYSADNKFFFIISTRTGNCSQDYKNELALLFTQTGTE